MDILPIFWLWMKYFMTLLIVSFYDVLINVDISTQWIVTLFKTLYETIRQSRNVLMSEMDVLGSTIHTHTHTYKKRSISLGLQGRVITHSK